jgi:hypothetical protein
MNYLQCDPIVNVELQASQVPSLINNVLFSNLVSLCARLQGGLGRFPTINMLGQWNPLQQIQVMQALQTLASLGAAQMGQQRSTTWTCGGEFNAQPATIIGA